MADTFNPSAFARARWVAEDGTLTREALVALELLLSGSRRSLTLTPAVGAPSNPQAGMLVYADGVAWNPGSGEGVYRYSIAGAWVFVG